MAESEKSVNVVFPAIKVARGGISTTVVRLQAQSEVYVIIVPQNTRHYYFVVPTIKYSICPMARFAKQTFSTFPGTYFI